MNEIRHFDDLLQAARAQRERQRLLLVFAGSELPAGATPQQRADFERGEGGTLVPLMCVDKWPDEAETFAAVVRESSEYELPGQPWQLVFAAALSGDADQGPSDAQTDQALSLMVEAIKSGELGGYLPFDREGRPVALGRQA